MTDYRALLDEEVWAFLDEGARYYPPDAVGLNIADQRRVYDRMCQAFDRPHPAGVQTQDTHFADVSCRIYTPQQPDAGTVFFCHGGGFVVGGLESHDSICAELCDGANMRVVAVDYRLSPENPHPADFNDAWSVFTAVADRFTGPIVMCGDSAGGNLVAAVSHHARGRVDGRISGQLLIYPGLGGDWSKGSYVTHADAPGLSTSDMEFYINMRSGGQDKTGDATFAPLQDTDFGGLPATVILTAQCDALSSDGETYRDAIVAAGGQAVWIEESGLVHAHLRARAMSAKARQSFERSIVSLKALAQGQLPDL